MDLCLIATLLREREGAFIYIGTKGIQLSGRERFCSLSTAAPEDFCCSALACGRELRLQPLLGGHASCGKVSSPTAFCRDLPTDFQ